MKLKRGDTVALGHKAPAPLRGAYCTVQKRHPSGTLTVELSADVKGTAWKRGDKLHVMPYEVRQ